MKNLSRGRSVALGLALVAAGLAAPPALGASAAAAPKPDPTIVDEMRDAAAGEVAVRANPATGEVGFVRAEGARADLLPDIAADNRAGAIDKADGYIDEFAGAFGATASQLQRSEVFEDKYGWTMTYEQTYQGLPVFGAEVKAHVDKAGDLTSVNGFAAPDLTIGTTPSLTKSEAAKRALAMVRNEPTGYEDGLPKELTEGLKVRSNELMIYRMGSPRGIDGEAKLAWVLEVWNASTVRETVVLDALTGKSLNRWSMMAHALERHLIEAYDGAEAPEYVWDEGDAWPVRKGRHPGTLDEDHQNELLGASETYWLFENTFGYDSWDGAGGPMTTVNNHPGINCPNANWNGVTTNYCDGVTGDDTVAHEWGHAYTESTSGLIYQWQAGAMNEAYSDIWGEVVDMRNERHNELGEDAHEGGAVLRTPGLCSDFTRSLITMEITAPAGVAGDCNAAPASFGPVFGQTPVTGTAIVGVDGTGTLPDGTPDDSTGNGCLPFENAAELAGNWVYVDRGACTFDMKAENAEAAGALGIVVGDNVAGRDPISMSGDAEIYGVMVTLEDGQRFKSAGEPVSFEIAAVPAETDDSYRWLSGENDPAFGGAIRDMWNPNCYGHPGAVSDEEYHCSEDDSGGVHSNSGVVNRTFAILVDGLPGVVEPIGLDKAANVFWRAQSTYLTPTSYFPDLADALEQSCVDLTGRPINEVTLGNPTEADGSDGAATPEVIADGLTEADCAAVTDAIAETELRLDPTDQCEWEPLLQPDAPELDCGDGSVSDTTWQEDFEDGLVGWTQNSEIVYGHGYPWTKTTSAPGGRTGTVAFAPDPAEGNACTEGPEDVSSRNSLISPSVTVPEGTMPRLEFDHYVATEAGYDGANVKVSVNGGRYRLVPEDAYLFNAPGGTLETAAAGNTNPMAGEPAWTGTDGGQLHGSWGTSIIDLSEIAAAGDALKFRFDMGRDGCNGVDGWYVDDIAVQVCIDEDDAVFVNEAPPVISGTPELGETLTATPGTWSPEPETTELQWMADGEPIAGATGETYTLTDAELDKLITVQETVTRGNFDDGVESSNTLGPVTEAAPEPEPVRTTTRANAPNTVEKGRSFRVTVRVTGAGGPDGTVQIRKGARVLAKGTVRNGTAVVRVSKNLPVGRHTLVAAYLGNADYRASRDAFRIRVVR